MSSRFASLLFMSFMVACDCGGEPTRPCDLSSDCAASESCIDSVCVSLMDASPDGGVESGADRSVDTVPLPECSNTEPCTEGVCVSGMCCGAENACGATCCGDGESCFADTCVVPGRACVSTGDCESGEYCEPSFGETNMVEPPMGKVCLGNVQTGKCIPLPPECANGQMPGPGEICTTECEFRPEVAALNAEVQWAWNETTATEFPTQVDVWATPTVGRVYDTNCDGQLNESDPPNIIFVSNDVNNTFCQGTCRRGILRVLDGKTGQELWSLDKAEASSIGFAGLSVALGDLTGDGRMEIVAVTGERKVAVLNGEGEVLAISAHVLSHTADTFGWGGGLALADMDGDGSVEIAYSSTLLRFDQGEISLVFEGNGDEGGGANRALSFMVDLNGDGVQELLTGRTAYLLDGTVLWTKTGVGNPFPAVADFDADGLPDVVLVGSPGVFVVDGLTGDTKFGPATFDATGSGGAPTVADFDGDGAPEIGVAQRDFYYMFKPTLGTTTLERVWQAENHDFSSSVTGSTVFDFEGDGTAEVVYNDECFLWVYDGPTGNVRFAAPTHSFTATEASLVADVDGDGHAEIVMVSNKVRHSSWNCLTDKWVMDDPNSVRKGWVAPEGREDYRGITVFKDVANSWVGTRAMWNQHSYHVSNICDDRDSACMPAGSYGSIPATEASNWSTPWLNNFRQNVQDEGIFNAPDATISLSVACGPPVVLTAAVRNLGKALLPAGVQVGFYQRAGGVDTLIGMGATTGQTFPGGASLVSFETMAGTSPDASFVAKIEIDEAMRTFRECREDNNESGAATGICII